MRTDYTYDPETARMTRMKTGRASAPVGGTLSGLVQNLEYTYDPAGNIVGIDDHSRAVVFTHNMDVGADREFTYDSLYRLVKAKGREHDSFSGSGSGTAEWKDQPTSQNNLVAIHRYTETYSYDASGNITEIAHANHGTSGVPDSWTRTSLYETSSNRLRRTWTGSTEPTGDNVFHDLNGNMTRAPESAIADTWRIGSPIAFASQTHEQVGHRPEPTASRRAPRPQSRGGDGLSHGPSVKTFGAS
jgi:YD repeat-containing protein